jgi:hypothetical protein
LIPEGLFNHCECLRSTFLKIRTKFDSQSLFLPLIHRENRHRSRTRLKINACEKLATSTQLLATWHTDSLDNVVLPSTSASRYHNCCIYGGASPEYLGYHLVYRLCNDSCTAISHISSNTFITLFQYCNCTSTHHIRPYRKVL